MSVYASSQRGSSKKRGGGGTFALKHITQSYATKQHWLPHLTMPQRQGRVCLALGLLITAIAVVQLLLVYKQTAMHVPDLHPLQTQQKAEATKLLQSLEDARQRLETVQADLRRQQAALATERAALERLRNATAPAAPAAPATPTLIQGILMHVDRPENSLRR